MHKFTNGADGGYPFGAPAPAGGPVYVTTSGDEVSSFGSIVELTPLAGGQRAWRAHPRYVFTNDANSSSPIGTLLVQGGVIYGTTYGAFSGPAPYGTIFAFTP